MKTKWYEKATGWLILMYVVAVFVICVLIGFLFLPAHLMVLFFKILCVLNIIIAIFRMIIGHIKIKNSFDNP